MTGRAHRPADARVHQPGETVVRVGPFSGRVRWRQVVVTLGAALLLLADVIGRVVARPGELQVGIVLALVGAPFFIALIRRRRLAGT